MQYRWDTIFSSILRNKDSRVQRGSRQNRARERSIQTGTCLLGSPKILNVMWNRSMEQGIATW